MEEGTCYLPLTIVAILVICAIFSKQIRYYFIADDDEVVVDTPRAFAFKLIGEEQSTVYDVFDNDKDVTYITVDEKYLNNDDVSIYVTGEYWNSPEKPVIKLNSKVIDDIFVENSGYADGVLSEIYYSKLYHFDINDTIEEGKEYEFYIRVRNTSKSTTVVFTTQDTENGELVGEYDW